MLIYIGLLVFSCNLDNIPFAIVDFPLPDKPVKNSVKPCSFFLGYTSLNILNVRITIIKTNRSNKIDFRCLDGPRMITGSKPNFKNKCFCHKRSYRNQCFVINDHLRHEFGYGTYLELKSSIGASDCLNITSVSLLGCSFMAGQGESLIFDP